DDEEDEEVVDAEGPLDDVAGDELDALLGPHPGGDDDGEDAGEPHPHHAPGAGLADRDRVGLSVEDQEVEGEHRPHERQEGDPGPERYRECGVHRLIVSLLPRWSWVRCRASPTRPGRCRAGGATTARARASRRTGSP